MIKHRRDITKYFAYGFQRKARHAAELDILGFDKYWI